MDVIVFPDVEQLVCDFLPDELAARSWDVTVGTRVPNPRPSKFVRVLAVGGVRRNLVQGNPTVVVEGWADKESDARNLCDLARALVVSMAQRDDLPSTVYRVDELSGVANLPDPDSAQSRYTVTLALLIRGSAL